MGNTIDIDALLGHTDWIRALALDVLHDRDRAEDVVQETWLAALQHLDGADRDGPRVRAWLARVARNFARMTARGESRRRGREGRHASTEPSPSTSETVERIALQQEVAAAVLALEPLDRDVVSLRYYDGLPPREIAGRLGLTPSAVSARLTRAKSSLRARLESDPGRGHAQWAVVAAGWTARRGAGDWVTPAALSGGLAVKTMMKVSAAVLVALVLGISAYHFFPLSPEESPAVVRADEPVELAGPGEPDVEPAVEGEEAADDESRVSIAAEPIEPVVAPVVAAPATGQVRVVVLHSGSDDPAVGIGLNLHPWDEPDAWFHKRHALTDEEGIVLFEDVAPGRGTVYIERLSEANTFGAERVEVVAGETNEVEFRVVTGKTVLGRVVDFASLPVPDARIWLGEGGMPHFGQEVARSDSDGMFELRHVSGIQAVAARASGYAPSLAFMPLFNEEAEGGVFEMELVLPGLGGALEGVVTDTAGRPLADAIVLVGNAEMGNINQVDGKPAYDAPVVRLRTGPDGGFRVDGLPAERTRVRARSLGSAVAEKDVEVTEGSVANVRLSLGPGSTIAGVVRHSSGRAVVGGKVQLEHDVDELSGTSVLVKDDGSFELPGVPVGTVTVIVGVDDENLFVQEEIETRPGEVSWWEPVFPSTGELSGQLVDGNGHPLVGWHISREATDEGVADEMARATVDSDANGHFRFEACPLATHRVEARAPGRWFKEAFAEQGGAFPGGAQVVLTVPLSEVPRGRLSGRIVDADGNGVGQAKLTLQGDALFLNIRTDAEGRFQVANLPAGGGTMSVSAAGYRDTTVEVEALVEDEVRELEPITLVAADG